MYLDDDNGYWPHYEGKTMSVVSLIDFGDAHVSSDGLKDFGNRFLGPAASRAYVAYRRHPKDYPLLFKALRAETPAQWLERFKYAAGRPPIHGEWLDSPFPKAMVGNWGKLLQNNTNGIRDYLMDDASLGVRFTPSFIIFPTVEDAIHFKLIWSDYNVIKHFHYPA